LPDTTFRIGKFQIGCFESSPELGSRANYDIARSWLSACRDSHPECLSSQAHELPTRVIDVDNDSNPSDVRVIHSNGAMAEYIALSHCWGGPISPLLTTQTISQFTRSLQCAILPPNFQDAIAIARQLGIRYLWIDSLCILQDSKTDWEVESQKMGLVYRNSVVTISALASRGSKDGIISHGQCFRDMPKAVLMNLSTDGSTPGQVSIRPKYRNAENLRELEQSAPLSTRGWTLQESILSPRHLYFGKEMIYWKCPQGFDTADGLPPGNTTPPISYPILTTVIYSDILNNPCAELPDKSSILEDYYQLINNFTQRSLTFGTDKLPALSGIAQRLHAVIGGDYLAGIWSNDIKYGLLWKSELNFCGHVQPYRAPSWSWAVTDGPVVYHRNEFRTNSPSAAEVIGYSVESKSMENPYGEVAGALLTIKARTKPLIRSHQLVSCLRQPQSIGSISFDECASDMERAPMVIPSLFRTTTEKEDCILSILTEPGDEDDWSIDNALFFNDEYILALITTDDSMGGEYTQTGGECIVLRPVPGTAPTQYQRIGYAETQEIKISWLETWDWKVLDIV
jgi:hypothetical protein